MTRRLSAAAERVLSELNRGEPLHGYELIQRTGVKSGTLYPLLRRLEERGLVVSEWEEPELRDRPARRYYMIRST